METPDPDVTEVFDTVFAEITPSLAAQRQQLLTELAEGKCHDSGSSSGRPRVVTMRRTVPLGARCGPSFRS